MKALYRNKNIPIAAILLLVLALLVIWRNNGSDLFLTAQNYTFDTYQRIKPREPIPTPVSIIDINSQSLSKVGQWPWPRPKIAQMIERLNEMGAAVIAIDMIFSEPDRTSAAELIRQLEDMDWQNRNEIKPALEKLPDNDRILADTLAKSNIVLAFFMTPPAGDGNNVLPVHKGSYALVGGDPKSRIYEFSNSAGSLKIFQEQARSIAVANPSVNTRDDVIRKIPAFVHANANIYSALSLDTLRVAQKKSSITIKSVQNKDDQGPRAIAIDQAKVGQFTIPLNKNGEFNIYYAPHKKSGTIPAHQLYSDDYQKLKSLVEGHIVLVGTSAEGLEDIRLSVLGEKIPGVAIHAQIIDQILTGQFLSRPEWAKGAEITMGIVICLLILIILPFVGPLFSALIGSAMVLMVVTISWWSFSNYGLLIDPFFPSITAFVIFLLSTVLRFAITEREKRFVRSAFQHYLAPDLLNKLEQNPDTLKLGGEIRDMTLMFMDIRGFTPISEKLKPEELVDFLNQLLSPLSSIILKHDGAIDKYIGDCIMAFWNAPLDVKHHRRKAALAALRMIQQVNQMNVRDEFRFKQEHYGLGNVEIGIGINSGLGCVGNMGSSSRFDYSVVGDTVNIAARIEASCKEIGWPILLSEDTAGECTDLALLDAGKISLKGKSKPVTIYALIGDEDFARSDYFTNLNNCHSALMESIKQSDPSSSKDEIMAQIKKCQQLANADLSSFYEQLLSRVQ